MKVTSDMTAGMTYTAGLAGEAAATAKIFRSRDSNAIVTR